MNDNYNDSGPNTAHQPPPNRDMSYHEDYQNGNNYYGHPNRSMNGNDNINDNSNGNGNGNDMNGDKSNRHRKRSSHSRSISRSRSRSRSVSSRRNNRKSHHTRSRTLSRSVSRSPRPKGRERRDRRRSRSRSRSTSRSRYRYRRSRNRRSESRSRSPLSRRGGRRRSGGRSMSPGRDLSRSRSRDRSTTRRSRSPRRGRNQNSPHRRSLSRDRSRSLGRGGNFGQPPHGMDDDTYRRGPPMMHRGDPPHHGYPERNPYGPGVSQHGGGGGGYGNYGHPAVLHGPGGNGPALSNGGGGGRDRRRGRRGGAEGVSLLVRNLSADITTHDLEHAFRRIGAVRDVYIPTDYHSRQPKGFAFVEYATKEEATEAKNEMNRFLIKGRHLEVLFAQEKRKTPGEMKGRSDGDEGGNGGRVRSSSFERHMERERRGMMRSGPLR